MQLCYWLCHSDVSPHVPSHRLGGIRERKWVITLGLLGQSTDWALASTLITSLSGHPNPPSIHYQLCDPESPVDEINPPYFINGKKTMLFEHSFRTAAYSSSDKNRVTGSIKLLECKRDRWLIVECCAVTAILFVCLRVIQSSVNVTVFYSTCEHLVRCNWSSDTAHPFCLNPVLQEQDLTSCQPSLPTAFYSFTMQNTTKK